LWLNADLTVSGDLIDGVAGVFELEIDRLLVVSAVILEGFHEVFGEVGLALLWVAVAPDLVEFFEQEAVVVLCGAKKMTWEELSGASNR
jgi:hypothetical protein